MRSLVVSFEVFPPKKSEMEARLWEAVRGFSAWSPAFISVTQGAFGSGGAGGEHPIARTRRVIERLRGETDIPVAPHMTCAGSSREALLRAVRFYKEMGVDRIVALRGDMPDMASYAARDDGFASTPDFIRAIRGVGDFDVSVSAYPERHPESASVDEGIDLLKRKVEAGACRAITQFVFDTDCHLRYLERVRLAGIEVPIVHGIIPTTNFSGIVRMAGKCGASVPGWLRRAHEVFGDSLASRRSLAVRLAVEQCERLIAGGSRHFHIYTLNQGDFVREFCEALGLSRSAEA